MTHLAQTCEIWTDKYIILKVLLTQSRGGWLEFKGTSKFWNLPFPLDGNGLFPLPRVVLAIAYALFGAK